MKHRVVIAVAAAVGLCVMLAGAAGANHGGRLYSFSGELTATPGPNATSLSVQVETGNKPALRALIGASQDEVFALGQGSEILVYEHGVPHVGSTADLQSGQYVTLKVHAPAGSSLQTIESTPAGTVSQTAAPGARRPLWLFIGTVAGGQAGGKISMNVDSGNWKALHALLGQPLAQTFAYDDSTIFLLWQGRVPTVIDPSQLKAGDQITVRIRAPRNASLGQVESIPANHVGDHEPAPAPEE